MTPERWRQVSDLFHAGLERDPGSRAAFLREATAGDPDLLREVQTLIDTHERAHGFLDEPAWGIAADLILEDERSLIGRRIGTYVVREEIGRGGMGVVYAAEDERLGRQVALKALTPEFTRDRLRRDRLTREARAAAALSHPAIATIFALEEIDGELYIISELVRGRTLRDELGDGPLPPDRLIATLVDIAAGLAAAHDRGIVHRDLKPENVMRRDDGQIKILDFGLARSPTPQNVSSITRLTEAGIALGTPGYMSPEQLAGREVDARSDVFAFGVLAWELATGEHPFGADPAAVLARMTELMEGRSAGLTRPLPLAGLDRIARRCMRAAASERYASSGALVAELQALQSGGSAAAMAAPSRDEALYWWRFHQAAIAALNAAMPIAAWTIRHYVERPFGSAIFFATLALATVSVTLRLNLWFTSRVHPAMLVDQRARLYPAIVIADVLLAGTLLAAAGLVAGTSDELAALLLSVPVVMLASLGLIEPTTTRAAGLVLP